LANTTVSNLLVKNKKHNIEQYGEYVMNSEAKNPEEHIGYALSTMMSELTIERIGRASLDNAEKNLPDINKSKSILDLHNTELMEGDSALIIAAGPSIHRFDTAQMIKDSGYDGVIITTESAMTWCLKNDIKPDLVITVDPHPDRIVRWFGDPNLTEEALAADDYFERQEMDPDLARDQIAFNNDALKLINKYGPDMRIAVSSSASDSVVGRIHESGMQDYWWNPFFDDYDLPDSITRQLHKSNGLPCLNAGGNVGTASWVIAHAVLEKKKIGLLGIDFGYYGDTTYRETQYYNELLEIFGKEKLPDIFTHIHNPFVDKEFFTDPTYLWYRRAFLEMAEQTLADGVVTYNCTGGGTLFGEGVEFVAFEDFVEVSRS
jgi:hypothetical protein